MSHGELRDFCKITDCNWRNVNQERLRPLTRQDCGRGIEVAGLIERDSNQCDPQLPHGNDVLLQPERRSSIAGSEDLTEPFESWSDFEQQLVMLGNNVFELVVLPVTLEPGLASDLMNPAPTGSATFNMTMGTEAV